jgi:hypothetical protein
MNWICMALRGVCLWLFDCNLSFASWLVLSTAYKHRNIVYPYTACLHILSYLVKASTSSPASIIFVLGSSPSKSCLRTRYMYFALSVVSQHCKGWFRPLTGRPFFWSTLQLFEVAYNSFWIHCLERVWRHARAPKSELWCRRPGL